MNWLNDIQDFFSSNANSATILVLAFFLIGVVVALILGGAIASKVSSRHIKANEDQAKAAVIASLIDVATEASVWNALSPQEQILSDRAVGQIDIRVRLLNIKGAGIAADWATHQLGEMKRNSATFGYQLDPAVTEFRDRLLLWLHSPNKANKIFLSDLERWAYQSVAPEAKVAAAQDAWVAQQYEQSYAEAATAPVETPEPIYFAEPAAPAEDALSALRPPREDEDDRGGIPNMF